ncbi:MAG: trypsin-like peptidase domain-containing protein [Bacteroidetes bacterium]|nr:trypsin-like peptidase domain-containing protein [Bacteroidota bacterium]
MNTDNSIIELTERYLIGSMSKEEVEAFELKIHQNTYLAQIVNEYILVHQSMLDYAAKERTKMQMQAWHSEFAGTSSAKIEISKPVTEVPKTVAEAPKTIEFKTPVAAPENNNLSITFWQRNKKHFAVAASVAVFSILSTIGISTYLDSRNSGNSGYIALKKDLEKIRQSQKSLDSKINKVSQSGAEKRPATIAKFGGTGFLLSGQGYVATSFHVIKDAHKLQVANNGFGYDATVVFSDPATDFAILKIQDSTFDALPFVPYNIFNASAQLGQKVFTLGYPRTDLVYGEGVISSMSGFNDDTLAYQISVPLNPGNSGGPVFDEQGNVVGLISAKQDNIEGAAFAVKSAYITQILNKLDNTWSYNGLSKKYKYMLARQNRVQQINTVKPCIFEVRVDN